MQLRMHTASLINALYFSNIACDSFTSNPKEMRCKIHNVSIIVNICTKDLIQFAIRPFSVYD